jgi:hypothetical protein
VPEHPASQGRRSAGGYYLADNEVSRRQKVCEKPRENVSVTGTVAEKDGKKVLTAKKVSEG